MYKTVGELLKVIKASTGKTVEEIAETIGYSRPYLSSLAKSNNPAVLKLLEDSFSKDIEKAPVKGLNKISEQVEALESTVSVLISRVSELVAEKTGRDVSVEIERLHRDAQYLARQRGG